MEMTLEGIEYRKNFAERLNKILQEKHKENNILIKESEKNTMSEALDSCLRMIIKRLSTSNTKKLDELDYQIEEQKKYLSYEDRINRLYMVANECLFDRQVEERSQGRKRYMSEAEVSAFAKERNITVEQALEELVPLGKIEGF